MTCNGLSKLMKHKVSTIAMYYIENKPPVEMDNFEFFTETFKTLLKKVCSS